MTLLAEARRGRRIQALCKYAASLHSLPSDEIVKELQSYIRRNYGVSDPTMKSYILEVLEKLPTLSQDIQAKLL